MKNRNKAGLTALMIAMAAAISPYVFRPAIITVILLVLALVLSYVAGVLRPKSWFVLTVVVTLLLISFSVFVGIMWSIGKSGV